MYFLQNGHYIRFVGVMGREKCFAPSTGKIDKEYGTAFYLLTAMPDVWNKCEKHTGDGIDFSAILESGRFSTGERVIIQLAWELFGAYGSSEFYIGDMLNHLDTEKYQLCLEAMRVRKAGFDIDMEIPDKKDAEDE